MSFCIEPMSLTCRTKCSFILISIELNWMQYNPKRTHTKPMRIWYAQSRSTFSDENKKKHTQTPHLRKITEKKHQQQKHKKRRNKNKINVARNNVVFVVFYDKGLFHRQLFIVDLHRWKHVSSLHRHTLPSNTIKRFI